MSPWRQWEEQPGAQTSHPRSPANTKQDKSEKPTPERQVVRMQIPESPVRDTATEKGQNLSAGGEGSPAGTPARPGGQKSVE